MSVNFSRRPILKATGSFIARVAAARSLPLISNGSVQAQTSRDASENVVLGAVLDSWFDGSIIMTNLGFAVRLQSPLFLASGSVLLDASKTFDDEYELGFMQTLFSSTGIEGLYLDENGNIYQTRKQYYTSIPLRDGVAGVKP